MKRAEIFLSKYGRNLGSRMFAKEVFSDIKNDLIVANEVYLNFSNVDRITLSFGTELIDSIAGVGVEVYAGHYNSATEKMVKFCLNNVRAKEILV